jgi:hypothetical protein
MSDAGSHPGRKWPTPTTRPPSSHSSDSSWTSTVEASPESFSDSELSESDVEESLNGDRRVAKVERPLEPLDTRHPTENDLMMTTHGRADSLSPKKKGPGRPRKLGNARPGEPVRRNLRVKTGCHTCRKRKKKCDEAKPECESMRDAADDRRLQLTTSR